MISRILALALACASFAFAQTSGRLTGSVADPLGSPIPAAAVHIFLPGGSEAVARTETTVEGLFAFTALRPQLYDVQVEAPGFQREVVRGVKIDTSRETTLPQIELTVGAVNFTIEVSAQLESLQTTSSTISVTVNSDQIRRLPLLDRDPLRLIATQAGVGSNRGSSTVINGQRSSFTNITFDGASIQDNYIRSNGVDFTPNFLVLDQVAEFTVVTSNADATVGGGTSQVNFVSPSGTNSFHGTAYWSHRNSKLAANDWFANADKLGRPSTAQNQVGFTLAGPIFKDKLLFFQSFEFFRLPRRRQMFRYIPTADARRGIFSWLDEQGQVQKLDPRDFGLNIEEFFDPVMQEFLDRVPGPENINNFRLGDSTEGAMLNTGGYSFFARNDLERFNSTTRLDYIISAKHSLTGSLNFSRSMTERAELSNDYSDVPKVSDRVTPKLASAQWRWNPSPQFTNELRGAFNLAPIKLVSTEEYGSFTLDPLTSFFSSPDNLFAPEGRDTNTFHLYEGASWVTGSHHVQFGFQARSIHVRTEDEIGIVPSVQLRGVDVSVFEQDWTADQANTAAFLYANLLGNVGNVRQTFNIRDRSSGFIPDAPRVRNYRHSNYSFYLQDDWRPIPKLTLNLGLRYEVFTVPTERDGLALSPLGLENNALNVLRSNATIDFAGSSVGRPFYALDKNNFAPAIGFAYDLLGAGDTVLRGAYSVHYVNDETIRTADFITQSIEGLFVRTTGRVAPDGVVSLSELPDEPLATPEFQMPVTLADTFPNNGLQDIAAIDPNLRTPYIHQWSIGLQQRMAGSIVEARYVGYRALQLTRTLDFNSPIYRENGFLDDFRRAQSNATIARQSGFGYDPSYNPDLAGSQMLDVFPNVGGGGILDDPTVRGLIETGEVAALASFYNSVGLAGDVAFLPNPLAVSAQYLTNASSASYHALQLDLRRRLRDGLQLQANYAFSKVLSDSDGTAATREDPYLDPNNGSIEKARAPFDLNHAIKANFTWDVPLFGGRSDGDSLAKWFGGWSVSGIMTWQSGAPFSILSGRRTINDGSAARLNTVNTALSKDKIDALLGVQSGAGGPSFIDPSAVGSSGMGNLSVFENPEAGQAGELQRRAFSGPWTFNLDFAVLKNFQLTERQSIEFRGEAANLLNNASWIVGDMNINEPQFGRISSVAYDSRRVQLGLYYRF